MAEPKTKKTEASVGAFLAKITPASKRADAEVLSALFERVVGAPAKMWGPSILGFGESSYSNSSGKEIPWFVTGFSPRAQHFALYLSGGMEAAEPLFAKVGKHSTAGGLLLRARSR